MESSGGLSGIGIPFYSEAEWHKARAVMEDGHTFHRTYAEFVARVAAVQEQLRQQGTPSVRVYIEVERFVDWCRARGRAVDARSRAEFAGEFARDHDAGRQAGNAQG